MFVDDMVTSGYMDKIEINVVSFHTCLCIIIISCEKQIVWVLSYVVLDLHSLLCTCLAYCYYMWAIVKWLISG